jgi:SAM-dependent methyltransferase
LTENIFLLPKNGTVLDLACGLGANALLLAKKGLKTHAWDNSAVALKKLNENAVKRNLSVITKKVFIEPISLPKNTFDVIVVSRFLDRFLCDAIIDSLKQGGLLYYQTYTKEKLNEKGPNNPAFLLDKNELLKLFNSLQLVVYRDNSVIGDVQFGERNEAFYIG